MDRFKFYFYYLDSQFIGFPLIIRITIIVVMLLLVLYLLTIFKIIFIGVHEKKEIKRKEKIRSQYEIKLKEIIYSSRILFKEDIQRTLGYSSKNKQALNKKWQKEIITNLLLFLKNEHQQDENMFNQHNFSILLELFNIHLFWEKRANSSDKSQNVRALRKLDDIEVGVSGLAVSRQIHNRDGNLRKLAKVEYLKFNKNEAFKFLDESFDKQFNNLDGLRIHTILKAKRKILPPFTRWIQIAKDENYKCFLINECALFHQIETAPYLLELYQQTDSSKIKIQIAKALGILNIQQAVPILIKDFNYVNLDLQNAIINTVGNFRTQEALDFLTKVHDTVYSNETIINIVQGIYKIDKGHQQVLPKIKAQANAFTKTVLLHAEYNDL